MTLPSFFRSCAELPLPPASSIAGGTYIVTGSNTGLGYHCAQHLILLHAARVILAVRSPSKGATALASIRAHTGQPDAGERKTGLGAHRYPLSKLMQVYMVRHLAGLLPVSETGVVINVLDPGICATDLARNMPWFFRAYIGVMRVGYGISAEQGSRKLLHGVTAGEASHGAFLAEMEVMEVPAWAADEAGRRVQARVWDGLVEVLGKRG
ncbi:Short chain dehydrogenase atnD, partial [Colletotrichum sp. SAR 10_66]